MTKLTKKVHRMSSAVLDGSYGPDRDKRIAVTLLPNNMIELRPERTQRPERIALIDVYRYALRCRANAEYLAKARVAKEKKATRLAAERQARAEKRLLRD